MNIINKNKSYSNSNKYKNNNKQNNFIKHWEHNTHGKDTDQADYRINNNYTISGTHRGSCGSSSNYIYIDCGIYRKLYLPWLPSSLYDQCLLRSLQQKWGSLKPYLLYEFWATCDPYRHHILHENYSKLEGV